jgi:hypothetical protein
MMTQVSDRSPRAPIGRSHLAREGLLGHTTIFLNSSGTNATATLAMLQQENKFFLLTAQHVARVITEKGEQWSFQNPALAIRHLNHPPLRTDLGNEASYSQDLTLFELHAEDAAEMVRLGLSFYDLRTSQYSSDQEYGPDYFIIGAPKSSEVIANRELSFEIRCVGVNILEEIVVDDVPRFVEVEAVGAVDYSGMSGGGLWEISYPAAGGHRVLLVGVVVREPQSLQSTVDTCWPVGRCTIQCSSRQPIKELVRRARSLALGADEQNN